VGVIAELVGNDGVPMRSEQIEQFARTHGLPFLHIADLVRARRATTQLVTRSARAQLPLDAGPFAVHCYTSMLDGVEHLALVLGDVAAADSSHDGVLVRVHSESA
jgi:3,4-dihydroxy 2-butanone 4-phosphate synthase/GTP cyclohydrolase II